MAPAASARCGLCARARRRGRARGRCPRAVNALGASSGSETPRLVLGTMRFGSATSAGGLSREEASRLFLCAYELGIREVDTAEMYPSPAERETHGLSEAWVGAFARERPEMRVTTKVAGPGSMPWIRDGPRALSAEDIRSAAEASCLRLGVDVIDTLLLHWPDRYVPSLFGNAVASEHESTHLGFVDANDYGVGASVEEQVEALAALVEQGVVRSVGLSNETAYGVAAFAAAAAQTPARPRVVSNAFSLLNRTVATHGVQEACRRLGIHLMGYSPLANGALAREDVRGGAAAPADDPEDVARYDVVRKPNARLAVAEYARIARGSGLRLSQMALRFALSRGANESVVVGPRDEGQLAELCAWRDEGPLPGDVLAAIDGVHDRFPSPCP